jgi:outer membrane biosynthesis protein TonB
MRLSRVALFTITSIAVPCLLSTTAITQARSPEIKEATAATYPRLALIERISGDVVIRVDIGRDGLPVKVSAVSGNKLLYGESLRLRWITI